MMFHVSRRLSSRVVDRSRRSISTYYYTRLDTSRALLSISGNDSVKFLQGLISNDVNRVRTTRDPLYAGVLKADGKLLHDIFLYANPTPAQSPSSAPVAVAGASSSPESTNISSFLIEHDSQQSSILRAYLRRHILRSKVKLGQSAEENLSVYAAWKTEDGRADEGADSDRLAMEYFERNKIGTDTRAPGMGWRWVTSGKVDDHSSITPSPHFVEASLTQYHLHRLLLSVPEGPVDWPSLPLEGNLDLMNGVDYRKGCYVGQELTARTHHRGVVRKRVVGLRLFKEGERIPTEFYPSSSSHLVAVSPITSLPSPHSSLTPLVSSTARPRPSGKLGSSLSLVDPNDPGSTLHLSIGCVRLEQIEKDGGVFAVSPPAAVEGEVAAAVAPGGDRWLAKAFVPRWIQDKLDREKAEKEQQE